MAMMLLKILPILPHPAQSNQPHETFASKSIHYQFQWTDLGVFVV